MNYWAGYEITFDEVPMLKKKMNDLKTQLFKKAGSSGFNKIGEAEIYDLGGNVAEYFEYGIYGYSAYDYCDPNNSDMIRSDFIGFRVIKNCSLKYMVYKS